MSLVDLQYIKTNITTNNGQPLSYRWTHGATEEHLGDGLVVYSLIQMMRAKVCVCIGSGSGYIPRIMTQARIDLHKQKIFDGNNDYNWGDIGVTYLVDACNGIGGPTDIEEESSFFRSNFYPRLIKSTSIDAYYNFFVRQDIQIDFLFIDGDHSYEGVKSDFELYSNLLSPKGIIVLHDTDPLYEETLIVSEDAKKDYYRFDGPSKLIDELKQDKKWNLVSLHNFGVLKDKPSSSGITVIQYA